MERTARQGPRISRARDFSLLTAVGSSGGPESFVVKRRDGSTYEYGTDGNSRVLATGTGTARVWMLRKISDRAGNRVLFAYKAPEAGLTGSTSIDFIEWTATSAGASTFVNKIAFAYSANAPRPRLPPMRVGRR